eukprot:15079488-Alexandrium_andersonii.AAC.1
MPRAAPSSLGLHPGASWSPEVPISDRRGSGPQAAGLLFRSRVSFGSEVAFRHSGFAAQA